MPHFHLDGKEPSSFTKALLAERLISLPFDDERDFEEHKRGFIAAPDYTQIMADAGNVAWDMGRYDFLLEGRWWCAPDTTSPRTLLPPSIRCPRCLWCWVV